MSVLESAPGWSFGLSNEVQSQDHKVISQHPGKSGSKKAQNLCSADFLIFPECMRWLLNYRLVFFIRDTPRCLSVTLVLIAVEVTIKLNHCMGWEMLNKRLNIYIDIWYAFETAHIRGAIYSQRGLLVAEETLSRIKMKFSPY